MKKKILVITPRFPFLGKGACEQDRAWGIRRLAELGFEVEVITKNLPGDEKDLAFAEKFSGAKIIPVIYSSFKELTSQEKREKFVRRFKNPLFLDGAAFEYSEPEIQKMVKNRLDVFKPDLVWFDYTYLWPLYFEVRKRGIPIVTRSINFEPVHFLEEDGRSFVNYLKFIPKLGSEILSCCLSDVVLSITPKEEKLYRKICGSKVSNLPLRGLPRLLKGSHVIGEKENDKLRVFFMGSTYNVVHNRRALHFILSEIAPRMKDVSFGSFVFHVIGSKVPEDFKNLFNQWVIYDGPKYGQDLEQFLSGMDIALIPSLMGAGMQQKIFEPLSRGIPTLTSERGIADYPFVVGESVMFAIGREDFVNKLLFMRNCTVRKNLSKKSIEVAKSAFNQDVIDQIVKGAIDKALNKR